MEQMMLWGCSIVLAQVPSRVFSPACLVESRSDLRPHLLAEESAFTEHVYIEAHMHFRLLGHVGSEVRHEQGIERHFNAFHRGE